MSKLFPTLLVLSTILVPSIVLSNNGTCTNSGTGTNSCTDTKLELVPKSVPMVPMVPKGPLDASKLIKGAHYLSLKCNLHKDLLDQVRVKHGMDPVWWGVNYHAHTFFLHRNSETSNWGLFVGFNNGKVCVVSTGDAEALVIKDSGVLH